LDIKNLWVVVILSLELWLSSFLID
jgi:hypothetical protein